MRKIAIEEHISKPEYMRLRDHTRRAQLQPFPLNPEAVKKMAPMLCDEGKLRLEEMERYEIQRAVLMSGTPFDYFDHEEEAVRYISEYNNYIADVVIPAHPDKYLSFASLPLMSGREGAKELRRVMKLPGNIGAVISGMPTEGKFIDEPEYDQLWEAAEESGALLYLHPSETPLGAKYLYRDLECLNGSAWSWGTDTATYVLRIIFRGIFDRYPKIKLIVGHLGEMLPYALERIDKRWSISPCDSQNKLFPSEYFKRNIYLTTSGNLSEAALTCAIEAVGYDRIMFAVDYPFESNREFARFIEEAEISEEARKAICYGNMERLLGE